MESRNTDNQSVGDFMVMLDFIRLNFVFKRSHGISHPDKYFCIGLLVHARFQWIIE
jgi:hypothetical protein